MSDHRKILYADMDNLLLDFRSGIAQLDVKTVGEYEGRLDDVPGIFALMRPVEGAVERRNCTGSFSRFKRIGEAVSQSSAIFAKNSCD